MKTRTRVVAEFLPEWEKIGLFIVDTNQNTGEKHIATNLVMSPLNEAEYNPALIRIDESAAQEPMDSLWSAGIRPKDFVSIHAVEAHLQDMRSIAFAKLGVTMPGKG